MRASTKDMMDKIHNRLINVKKSDKKDGKVSYVNMDALLEECNLSKASIYRCMRLLRENGIGIYHRVGFGYVLAEFAGQKDDVHTLRRINGRRTSDMINLHAAHNWMKSRWKTDWERRQLSAAIRPLLPSLPELEQSNTVLLKFQNSLGM